MIGGGGGGVDIVLHLHHKKHEIFILHENDDDIRNHIKEIGC